MIGSRLGIQVKGRKDPSLVSKFRNKQRGEFEWGKENQKEEGRDSQELWKEEEQSREMTQERKVGGERRERGA